MPKINSVAERRTYINAPPERRKASPDDGVLVNSNDLGVGEDLQGLFAHCWQLCPFDVNKNTILKKGTGEQERDSHEH